MQETQIVTIHAEEPTQVEYRYSLLIELRTPAGTITELFHCTTTHLKHAVYEAGLQYEGSDYDILTSIRRPRGWAKAS